MAQKYYIGIDMGTDSVGWAVTDEQYNLQKAHGHDLWGSYLFGEAQSAAERRGYRANRRRLARVRQRIMLLQQLFAKEVAKVDPLFFVRLNNSSLLLTDKDEQLKTSDALFADSNFDDKKFFKQYKTIYHLRMALIQNKITDVRLLYLALHHIIKNRGHFLFEGQSFDIADTEIIRNKFFEINAFLSDREQPTLDLSQLNDVLGEIKKRDIAKSIRQKNLSLLLHTNKQKSLVAIVKAITGGNVNIDDLFDLQQQCDITKFCFESSGFEKTEMPAIESQLGADNAALIYLLKSVYDWSILCNIMGNRQYISQAKVDIYNAHHQDLQWLKSYINQKYPNDRQKYNTVFRKQSKVNNYAAYIGMDKQKGFSKCSKEDFYQFLKKEVGIDDQIVLKKMSDGKFLPKQVGTDNSVIPYQLHLRELKAILNNAQSQFAFLNQTQDGTTVADKIVSLMTFRIPYYVGPLNNQHNIYSWAVRKEGYDRVSIIPWNFDKAIDLDASEERFIRRMTNKCTYLYGQDVLPANSLLYSEFAFLNELNNLKINGEKSSQAKKIILQYAREHKKVTLKACLKLLKQNGLVPADSTVAIFSGTDGDFKAALTSWNDLQFLQDKLYTHSQACEQVITWITLITDKKRLATRIRTTYGNIFTEDEIKRLVALNYSGWGRLSAMFLNGIVSAKCYDSNGECMTIIQAMRQTNENLMQLLADKYGFAKVVDEYNSNNTPDNKISYKTVQDLYCSPAVKRAIWRTVELVKEIVKIKGCAPSRLFIETAREKPDEKRQGKRTISRKQQILDLYKNIREEQRDWITEIESQPDSKFNSDKLVLYYRQMGKSMYSGKPISLEEVFNTNICDIDHIYPRSKIKDDSLDNRVLVYKNENLDKGDKYPLSADIRTQMTPFWLMLHQKEMISSNKLARLMRSTALTQDELADFINRQLVFTRQSTKAAAQILSKLLPDTEIVYSKAANANEFKDINGIIKVRELNDLHHAKDAYINIVVGNVYRTKFNKNAAEFFRNNGIDSYSFKHLYDYDIAGAWKVKDREKIINTANRNTARLVRFTSMGSGALFDTQPVPAGKNDNLVPLKAHGAIQDTSKYGGYNKPTIAYYMLVSSIDKKGNKLLSLEAYPLWLHKQTKGNADSKYQFLHDQLKLVEPRILIDNIKAKTLFCIEGSYACLSTRSGSSLIWDNANPLYLDQQSTKTLKAVCKYMTERKRLNKPDLTVGENITADQNLGLYDVLVQKLDSDIYRGFGNIKSQAAFLQRVRPVFEKLTLEQQCTVLFEILHLTQCNGVLADLTLLGGVAHAGKISTNKFIEDSNIKIIFQSPTGYYRRVVNIKDLL